jgi:hypothetical protein
MKPNIAICLLLPAAGKATNYTAMHFSRCCCLA